MRADTDGSAPRPTGGQADQTVRRLAREACSMVAGACAPRRSVRMLTQLAARDPALLDAAAGHCELVGGYEVPLREAAAQLLCRGAAQTRLARRQPQRGRVRPAGWRSQP